MLPAAGKKISKLEPSPSFANFVTAVAKTAVAVSEAVTAVSEAMTAVAGVVIGPSSVAGPFADLFAKAPLFEH